MKTNPLSGQKLSTRRRDISLRVETIALVLLSWIFVSTPVAADSVMALPGGGDNIMVTFDELSVGATFPLTHRGVVYTPIEADGWDIWVIPGMPITRFVKSPMLALVAYVEEPGEPTNLISLRLDFEQPTQFFGFGLGFNNRTQTPDGSLLLDIGSVVLEFSNGSNQVFPLHASRVVCCTEARFDYTDMDDGIAGNGLVQSAIITLDYKYDPFAPGSGYPGDSFGLKFMGIDDVSYSTAIVQASMQVAIDIYPGKYPNIINLKSNGFVKVAVLTEGDFDALQIRPDTTKFGPGHAVTARYQVKDVDSDGDDDLLLYYRIEQTGIACSDTQTTLTGELYDGTPISGTDSVQTTNCQ